MNVKNEEVRAGRLWSLFCVVVIEMIKKRNDNVNRISVISQNRPFCV